MSENSVERLTVEQQHGEKIRYGEIMKPSTKNRLCSTMAMFAGWFGTLHLAFGGGGALIPVKMLINNADSIVIAKVLDGAIIAQTVSVNLALQQVLKGPLQAGALIPVDYQLNADAARFATGVEKDRGLFFLKNTNGKLSILPVASGYISEFRRAFFVLPDNSTPKTLGSGVQASLHERILAELAGAFESGDGRSKGGFVNFMAEYRSNRSPAMKSLFAQFNSSTNARLRAIGFRCSIADGSDQAFAQLEQGLTNRSADDLAGIVEEIQYYFDATDSRAVANLGRLAASPASPAQLRKASLTALARIHTRESLPHLARFLDSQDAELQALAVGGLAMFANNVPAGKHEPAAGSWKYRTEETIRYSAMDPRIIKNNPASIAFWKSWWNEHRSEIESGKP